MRVCFQMFASKIRLRSMVISIQIINNLYYFLCCSQVLLTDSLELHKALAT